MSALSDRRSELVERILSLQDEDGCWNQLGPGDRYYPELKHYAPNYKSTLWTLILLADIECDPALPELRRPLQAITDHFFDRESGVYSIGKSHFPIPCLNGNMMYLHGYFDFESDYDDRVIDFFAQYQRFDDGDFKTPSAFPYFRNKSCYGAHTCYWGVTKLLKGLSFLAKRRRKKNVKQLIQRCIDFVLLHEVCYSSSDPARLLAKGMDQLTFPNMYHSDFLEVLWLLCREGRHDPSMNRALDLLKSKRQSDGTWNVERRIPDLITTVRSDFLSACITKRAEEVLHDA